MIPPLTKNQDNFSRTGPFSMYNSGNESYGHAASYAFGFIKKYLFFEKLEPKTFCDMFFITRFSEEKIQKTFFKPNFFRKTSFRKINISKIDISKIDIKLLCLKKMEKWKIFLKYPWCVPLDHSQAHVFGRNREISRSYWIKKNRVHF